MDIERFGAVVNEQALAKLDHETPAAVPLRQRNSNRQRLTAIGFSRATNENIATSLTRGSPLLNARLITGPPSHGR